MRRSRESEKRSQRRRVKIEIRRFENQKFVRRALRYFHVREKDERWKRTGTGKTRIDVSSNRSKHDASRIDGWTQTDNVRDHSWIVEGCIGITWKMLEIFRRYLLDLLDAARDNSLPAFSRTSRSHVRSFRSSEISISSDGTVGSQVRKEIGKERRSAREFRRTPAFRVAWNEESGRAERERGYARTTVSMSNDVLSPAHLENLEKSRVEEAQVLVVHVGHDDAPSFISRTRVSLARSQDRDLFQ